MVGVAVVKTRLHRIRPEPGANYTGAIHGLRTIVAKEGVRGLFNGFGVVGNNSNHNSGPSALPPPFVQSPLWLGSHCFNTFTATCPPYSPPFASFFLLPTSVRPFFLIIPCSFVALRIASFVLQTALGAGPAHAMYFACYEQAKVAFGASEGPARNPGGVAAAAVVATMAHEGTMTPIEVVKQRLQVHNSPYKGAMDCIRKTLAEEGVR